MPPPAGTIKLGELPRDRQPEPAAPWPVLAWLRHWHTPRRTTRLAGTVAAGLAMLTVTGAAAPPRPAYTPQLTVLAVLSYTYDERSLYTLEGPEPGRPRLVAYRLSDGTVRWQVPAPDGAIQSLQRWEGGLLLRSYLGPANTTTALDPETGQELWQQRVDDYRLDPVGEGHMLRGNFSAEPRWPAREPPAIELAAVDPATGQTEWTVSTTGTMYAQDAPDSPYLVVYNHHGDLRTYRLATGEQLAQRSVGSADFANVDMVGSLVLLTDHPPAVTAYDAATLTPQWSFTELDPGAVWPTRCGGLLCLAGEQSPRALDPATGELVWSADWLPPLDGHLEPTITVSELSGARLAGHLLLTEPPAQRNWLVNAGTGELVLDLQDWSVSPRQPPTAADPEPRLVRDTGTGALVGELSPDLSEVRLLGVVDTPPGSSCDANRGYVICLAGSATQETPEELTVWRYRLA